ncbi:MAG: propionyl-CoA synthetase [Pseudomonadota bacterium]|jgi:propionyl-CoA synthetase|nr:propionyl-CoA synthetase [Pseudomonadota bacterium]MEC7495735.1 propionyl-CoA synthetase [Pseudomonadota bacterium]MEC8309675.1 propionyl-CoA synthetase [Pseudomonadota bacterium]MEC8516004.1 propionyl-CoA synthetase [Pseudomonadota bacterium]MEC8539219.1 propionyl-CoA synthetase [Pseudomonadota bacterium]
MAEYREIYDRAQSDVASFWMEAASAIDWQKAPSQALDSSKPPFHRWFPDGVMNTCHNAVDRHVAAGRGDQKAVIYDSPITGNAASMSFSELQQATARFAGMLARLGVTAGDRVIIYMPMIPEAVVAMLGCARLGAVHSVVFGGFAAAELAKRIDDAQPKAIISASCGHEPNRIVAYKPLLDEAIELSSHKPDNCVIYQREALTADLVAGRDLEWNEAHDGVEELAPVPVKATDPLYILYTSGTTGQPKGVVRDNGGHAVALQWSMPNIYDVQPGDVYWAASDIGWVVGHSYIVYAPLIAGCSTVLFEGKPIGTPDAGVFWRVIEEHKVKVLFTAPTAFRAIKRADPDGDFLKKHDTSSLTYLFLAGERADPDTILWAQDRLGVPVIDHWWQTETGWSICSNPVGIEVLPVKLGSPSVPMPGYQVDILAEDGSPRDAGELGAIAVKLPLPPSCLPTIWRADQAFVEKYLTTFPGYYETGDAGYKDEDGYLYIMARTDDVINVAGHRLSTGQLEEVLAEHPDVAECAVIGVADELKGQLPLGLICLYPNCEKPVEAVCTEAIDLVKSRVGRVSAFNLVVAIDRLPKTRSGKVLRGTMAKIADGVEWTMPATIDDPVILDEIATALKTLGYPKRP